MEIKKIEGKENRISLWKQALLATVAVAGLCLSLAGCSSAEPVGTGKVPQSETTRICYVVESGDTLSGISNATGVYISDIEGIKQGRDIWPGDILYMNVPAESVEGILAGQNSDGLNGTFYLEEDTQEKEYWYVVGKNDFLEKIAKAFGVSVESILAGDCNIEDSDKIYPGQIIMIKSKKEISEIKGLKGGVFATCEEAKNYVLGQGTKPTQPQETTSTTNLAEGHQKILDFSGLAGEIDWDKLEASYKRGEFSGVILRIAENSISSETGTFSFTLDKQFERNIQEANKRGIRYGGYVLTRARTPNGIINQAEAASAYLKELETRGIYFRPSLPIYGDFWEHDAKTQMSLYNERKYEECVNLMVSFCDVLERDGWFTGIYANNKILDDILANAPNAHLISNYTQWRAAYGSDPKGPIAEIGYNNKVKLDFIKAIVQVAQYGEVDFTKSYVDVNIATEELMETVRNYYINKYGADYYNVNNGPSLRGGVTQIGFAPSRQERRHPGTTYEGVTSSLVSTCMNKSQRDAVAGKSIDSAFRGSNIKYTNGKPSFARFRGMPNKAIGTRTF